MMNLIILYTFLIIKVSFTEKYLQLFDKYLEQIFIKNDEFNNIVYILDNKSVFHWEVSIIIRKIYTSTIN